MQISLTFTFRWNWMLIRCGLAPKMSQGSQGSQGVPGWSCGAWQICSMIFESWFPGVRTSYPPQDWRVQYYSWPSAGPSWIIPQKMMTQGFKQGLRTRTGPTTSKTVSARCRQAVIPIDLHLMIHMMSWTITSNQWFMYVSNHLLPSMSTGVNPVAADCQSPIQKVIKYVVHAVCLYICSVHVIKCCIHSICT